MLLDAKMFLIIVAVILWLLIGIPLGVLFRRAGKYGFKGIVPILNGYTAYSVSSYGWLFFVYLALIIVGFIGFYHLNLVFSIFMAAAALVHIYGTYRFARAYGHGIIYCIGLLLVPFIFLTITAITSEYEGKYY